MGESLMNKIKKKRATIIICLILLAILVALIYRGKMITFKDTNLTKAVQLLAGKEENRKIYERDIKNILKKNNNMLVLSNNRISELDGLEKSNVFKMDRVDLSNNSIFNTIIANDLNTEKLDLRNQLIEIDLGMVDRYSELETELPIIYSQAKNQEYKIFTENNIDILGSGGYIVDDKIMLSTEGTGAQSTILEIVGGIADKSKIRITYFIIDKDVVIEDKMADTIIDTARLQEPGNRLSLLSALTQSENTVTGQTNTVPALIAQTELVGSININKGAEYTNNVNVMLDLNISGGKAPYQMRLSNNNIDFTGYEDYTPTKVYILPEIDGIRTVYVQYKDADGIVSNIFKKEIRLDTKGPNILLNISTTNNSTNKVKLEDVITIIISTDETLLNTPDVKAIIGGEERILTVTNNGNGTYTATYTVSESDLEGIVKIIVLATNEAGNTTTIEDTSQTIEKTPPIVTGVENNQITNQDLVITFDKGLGLLNGDVFNSGETVIIEGNYVLIVTDEAGNATTIKFEIDKTGPTGGILINGGAKRTSSTTSILTLSAIDKNGISKMCLSNDEVNWSVEEEYVELKSYTLPGTTGIKTVYVKYKDTIGNWSPIYSASIELNTTKPVLTHVSIESNNSINNRQATNGDTITVSVISDKTLLVNPTVYIKSPGVDPARLMSVSGSGNSYTATYTIPEDETIFNEGPFIINISGFEDEFGNIGETVINTTDGSAVSFIKLRPTIIIEGPVEQIPGGTATYTLIINGASETHILPEDIIINKRGEIVGGIVEITEAGNIKTISIIDISGYGYISIKVAADTIFNSLGNGNLETEFSNETLIDFGLEFINIQITGNSDIWTNQDVNLTIDVIDSRGRTKSCEILRWDTRRRIF